MEEGVNLNFDQFPLPVEVLLYYNIYVITQAVFINTLDVPTYRETLLKIKEHWKRDGPMYMYYVHMVRHIKSRGTVGILPFI